MKALTIQQPYAALIATGVKPIENRTWATSYRGPLLIHAGKSQERTADWDAADERVYGIRREDMAFGAIVAVVDLVACLHRGQAWPSRWRGLYEHEHAEGPWCWILENVRRLPVPYPRRGAQGLFDIDVDLATIGMHGNGANVDNYEPSRGGAR